MLGTFWFVLGIVIREGIYCYINMLQTRGLIKNRTRLVGWTSGVGSIGTENGSGLRSQEQVNWFNKGF